MKTWACAVAGMIGLLSAMACHNERALQTGGHAAALPAPTNIATLDSQISADAGPPACAGLTDGGKCLRAVQVAVGRTSAAVVLEDGTVRFWGAHSHWPNPQGAGVPVNVQLDCAELARTTKNVSRVALTGGGACVLHDGGILRCCGEYEHVYYDTECMDNTTPWTPSLAPVGTKVLDVAGSALEMCVLGLDHAVLCWGEEFGENLRNVASLPEDVDRIAVGAGFGCAVRSSGKVVCWGAAREGCNRFGQLGNGSLDDPCREKEVPCDGAHAGCPDAKVCWAPTRFAGLFEVQGIVDAIAVAVGSSSACALLGDGHVRCWGWQVTSGVPFGGVYGIPGQPTPTAVEGLEGVGLIVTGIGQNCAFTQSGSFCWGNNFYGRLGDGTCIVGCPGGLPCSKFLGLLPVLQGRTVVSMAAGYGTCAVDTAGGVWCWGDNQFGQLGQLPATCVTVPTMVDWKLAVGGS